MLKSGIMYMHRGLIVGLLLMLGSACSSPAPPNIVLIIGDDHGYPYFGFTGSVHVHTPHMDRLAHGGALFTQGHTTDNHCRPALQTLTTGLYPIQYAAQKEVFKARDQVADPEYGQLAPEEKVQWDFLYEASAMRKFETLPGLLSRAGYVSFQAGKWWEQSFTNGGFTEGMSEGWTPDEVGQPGFFGKLMGGDGVE
ncbi:MAG: sulfatase-like hydrolase/transferase, partial [Bacteroidetes bacterium]|nr:sulfatase-like hydrolase/transferase [Bacteroidota bacterium]